MQVGGCVGGAVRRDDGRVGEADRIPLGCIGTIAFSERHLTPSPSCTHVCRRSGHLQPCWRLSRPTQRPSLAAPLDAACRVAPPCAFMPKLKSSSMSARHPAPALLSWNVWRHSHRCAMHAYLYLPTRLRLVGLKPLRLPAGGARCAAEPEPAAGGGAQSGHHVPIGAGRHHGQPRQHAPLQGGCQGIRGEAVY